jgi:hypothetical protein
MSQVNLNIDDLKKLSSIIEQQNLKPQISVPDTKHIVDTELPKQIVQNKKVSFSNPTYVPVQSVPVQSVPVQSVPVQSVPVQSVPVQSVPVQSMTEQNTTLQINISDINLFGVSMPKHTLYLIILLTFIAIIIWYMSRDKKKVTDEKEKN